jgi:Tfp pilus assembly protein PilF
MLIPLTALCLVAIGGRVLTRLERRTEIARHTTAARSRILMAALVGSQQRLIAPLIVLTALGVMLIAHEATDSRGGRVALLIAALICMLGFALRGAPAQDRMRARRAGVAVLAVLALGGILVWRSVLGSAENVTATQTIDPSLGARLLVVAQALPLVGEFPLVGVGLGSWEHAFRLEQRPPIERGRWSHAHNDYLEFVVDTGLIGALILVWFAWAVTRAVRGGAVARDVSEPRDGKLVPAPTAATRYRTDRIDSRDDWMAVSQDWPLLRIGLAGGVGALLAHSLSDFHLQNPANTLIFMTLLGLLVLSAPTRAPGGGARAWAPVGLIAVIAFATAAPVFGLAPFTSSGAASAQARIADAHLALLATEDVEARDKAVLLARSAVELAPVEPDTHEILARALADEVEGDAAYRRAIWLSPDESQLRDVLAHRLWDRGEQAQALVELERSIAGAPYLAAHDYLALGNDLDPTSPRGRLRTLTASDSLPARLRLLDPTIQSAIERGLRRALEKGEFIDYDTTVSDLATLLEASGRHTEAAAFLEESAASSIGDEDLLRRAAVNYLTGGDFASAERVLTEQLIRMPENGELYRLLAVDVYAEQEDSTPRKPCSAPASGEAPTCCLSTGACARF